jgi:polyisoprenoid-binding protein YceI
MRKVFLIAGLMTAFAVAVVASSAAANFAGTWTLDKTKSQGLSPRMAGADKVTWTITQDAATISIDQKVEGGQPPAGGGGGGGGMGGGRPPAGPTPYKLDGSEATSDFTRGQMTGKLTLKATWAGDALELSRKTTFTTDQGDRTSTTTQKLSLSGDGKVLTAAVHSEGGQGGPSDSTLVFNK